MSQDYRDLVVWQKAIELAVCIYKLTCTFPKDEMYGLVSQMRRASVSIASNIAEGHGRLNHAEFRQFLGWTQGSTYELQTQLVVANRLSIGHTEDLEQAQSLSNEISKMLAAFIQTLNAPAKPAKAGQSQELEARS